MFADYFNSTTEDGPFAEMIEAVADRIREAVTVWMNETAFNSLRDEFIRQMDKALLQISSAENDTLATINQDYSTTQSVAVRCNDMIGKINQL